MYFTVRSRHFRFAEQLHGGVQFDGPEIRLPADPNLAIEHFSYRSVEHYVEKFNRYTSTEALNLAAHSAVPDWERGLRDMVRDLWLYYEQNHGKEDGFRGWVLSWLAGQYRWFSHAKLLDIAAQQDAVQKAAVPNSLDDVLAVMQDELGRLRLRSTNGATGVVFRSPLFDPSGYAEDGRTLLKAIAVSERPVRAEEIHWSDATCSLADSDRALLRSLTRAERPLPSITVTNCIPTLCEPDPRAAFNVLRTTFETDRIPGTWLSHLARFDEIWVWAHHNEIAFRRSGVPPEKIRRLPGFVDTSFFTPKGNRHNLPSALHDRFVFLSVFDWQLRKGWDVLLRAYCEEFSPDDKAGLLLKVSKLHGYTLPQIHAQLRAVLEPLGQNLSQRSDIVLMDETLDQEQMAALYRSVDAFVLASRGEGWGRPYQEAMATGLPTIGTRGSGNDDFMHDGNSFLVDTTLVPVSDQAAREITVYEGHQWQESDPARLRSCLRRVFQKTDDVEAISQQGLHDMREKYSLRAAAVVFEANVHAVEARLRPAPPPPCNEEQIRVVLEGEFFAGHSFANVNEQLALRWIADDSLAVSLHRVQLHPTLDRLVPYAHRLQPFIDRPLPAQPAVTIRHAFPPNWRPPEHGRWVHIQPWEFGHLPLDWVKPLRDRVDEIWAPSHYVKGVYVRSGIPAEKIHVIPWGVNPKTYRPDVPALLLPTSATFKFLFVGGTVARKGFDVLWQAYLEEFRPDEDVCLVVKDLGTSTFYRYGNFRDEILRRIAAGSGPGVVYLDDELTDGQRASLYAACDCLAAPYRGEGFGLPVLEAMACGLPPIVPRGGATDDFVSEDTAYLVPATVVDCHHDWRLCGPGTELAVDVAELRATMRRAYEGRETTRHKGRLASDHVRSSFTWEHTVALMAERIKVLAEPAPDSRPDGAPLDVATVPAADDLPTRAPVTALVVTHNHEQTLADCLARVAPFVREIVVLDLGSTDRTCAIAQEYGARIFLGTWQESFAQARNAALRRATSEWILSLSPHERLSVDGAEQLAELLTTVADDIAGFGLTVRDGSSLPAEHNEVRLFRNHNDIVFEFRASESVVASIERLGGRVVRTDLVIDRADAPPADEQAELFRLLHADLAERPRDPRVLWSVGRAHHSFGNFFHAECYLNDCLTNTPPGDAMQHRSLRLLVDCYHRIGDPYRAAEYQDKLAALPESPA